MKSYGVVVKSVVFGEGLWESKKDYHIEMGDFCLHPLREYKMFFYKQAWLR